MHEECEECMFSCSPQMQSWTKKKNWIQVKKNPHISGKHFLQKRTRRFVKILKLLPEEPLPGVKFPCVSVSYVVALCFLSGFFVFHRCSVITLWSFEVVGFIHHLSLQALCNHHFENKTLSLDTNNVYFPSENL